MFYKCIYSLILKPFFYHQDVLNDQGGSGHQNIRNFMQYGWEGIQFSEQNTLRLK